MFNDVFIITAAGGNPTAIKLLDKKLKSNEYSQIGAELLEETKKYGVEQCGFLIIKEKHFEMSGGEFCGNAARAAAIILANTEKNNKPQFTMSGFKNIIKAKVDKINKNKYQVSCTFENLQINTSLIQALGKKAQMVDLGGIVQIVIEGNFPKNSYKKQHRKITSDLNLTQKNAVGVCWIEKNNSKIKMHPVVWVRDINSFFYESSCGSGTIAVGKVSKCKSVIQPTDQNIDINIIGNNISLSSEMEIIKSPPK
ncbi:hypothetical protein C0580_00450 [Candidatus Parcubacteria bacterium]|nr:MAG: hypothetical protein C0580_00450 [Candidatus Parcubacteria bacterium]